MVPSAAPAACRAAPASATRSSADQDRDAGQQRDLVPERLGKEAQQVRVRPEVPCPGRKEDGVKGGEGGVERHGEEDAQQTGRGTDARPPRRAGAARAWIGPPRSRRPISDRRTARAIASARIRPRTTPPTSRMWLRSVRIQDRPRPSMLTAKSPPTQQVAQHRGGGPIDCGLVGRRAGAGTSCRDCSKRHERRVEEQQRAGQQRRQWPRPARTAAPARQGHAARHRFRPGLGASVSRHPG